jgi:hypothetical protein
MRAGNRTPALDVLRVAALVTPPGPEELLVALPNTTADEARGGRGRFMRGGPGGNLWYRDLQREGDTGEDLRKRVRAATR